MKTHENKWAGTIVEGQFVFSSNRYDSPYSGIMFELKFKERGNKRLI